MNNRLATLSAISLLICMALQACGGAPAAVSPTNPPPLPTATVASPATTVPVATVAPTTPPPLPTDTITPQPTKIQHVSKPGEPVYFDAQNNIDCVLGNTTGTNSNIYIPPTCDNPALRFIERPVAADAKTYLPYLDIRATTFGGTIDWVFAHMDLYDTPAPTGTGDLYYFFKFDLNFDGRDGNDMLISVKNLAQTALNWTVNGVEAWTYVDGNLTKIFDQGVGSDPDLIWARRSPKAIEFAFKPSLLKNDLRFVWWAWSYQGTLTPPDFALSSNPPDFYQIDNTCSWGFNVSASAMVNACRQK